MDSKKFFSQIRSVIREEIEYALDKKMKNGKKSDVDVISHGMSLYNETNKKVSENTAPKKKPLNSNFSSINDILEETRKTLQESSDMETEFRFTADMAEGFGYQKNQGAIPQGYSSNEIPDDVMSALTKDYSALMKKIDEKKGR
jgi:hypothetical protein